MRLSESQGWVDQELQPVYKGSMVKISQNVSRNGSIDPDGAELIRLGKKPVLRVSRASPVDVVQGLIHFLVAQFRVHVNAGLQLHRLDHLGSDSEVSVTLRRQAATDRAISVFQLGFEKYKPACRYMR